MIEKKNYCGQCGNQLIDDTPYCAYCGYNNYQVNDYNTQIIQKEEENIPIGSIIFLIVAIIQGLLIIPFSIVFILTAFIVGFIVPVDALSYISIFIVPISSCIIIFEAAKSFINKGKTLVRGIIISIVMIIITLIIFLIT